MAVTKVTDAMRNVTAVDATKISGAVPSASLTNVDLSKLEYNQAILAFKVATADSLSKFQMVDQVIDDFHDSTGIDAGASTNELVTGTSNIKYCKGGVASNPTGGASVDTSITGYRTHVFSGNASLTVGMAGNVDILVVAGGGSGGSDYGGGGGAGGLIYKPNHALTINTYDAVIGNGGASASGAGYGVSGADSTWTINGGAVEFTAKGGGGAAWESGTTPINGGSGGGGSYNTSSGSTATQPSESGDSGTYGFGYGGGTGIGASLYIPGGGGGAGSVGANAAAGLAGAGGAGKDYSSIFGTAVGDNGWFASGGGAGHGNENGPGGLASAGGGTQGGAAMNNKADDAQANTGGGAGGSGGNSALGSGVGGSGVILVRYSNDAFSSTANLTLQSTATTAESAPTTADLVLLIEDSGSGTATINTDIKAKVSRDGSAFSGYVTLVDEGDWGTDKRILVARNIDISGIASGTAMKYKIETLNQSAGVKETRIHSTSLAWA